MQISRIHLQNFKCFREVDVDLSKITLLTGKNSSGKTSLLYGLLGVLQSREFPRSFSPNGKYVNMGDFLDISFNNDKEAEIEIDITLKDTSGEVQFETTWIIDQRNSMPRLRDLEIQAPLYECKVRTSRNAYALDLRCDRQAYLASEQFQRWQTFAQAFQGSWQTMLDLPVTEGKSKEELEETQTRTVEQLMLSFEKAEDVRNLKFTTFSELSEKLAHNYNLWALMSISDLFNTLKESDRGVNFIGSFRLQPERTYYQSADSDKIGKFGENYIDQILEWERNKAPQFGALKSILRELSLLRTLRTRKQRSGRFEVRVQVQSRGPWASLADVGFGVGQFLPIIVADLQLPRQSTLIVSQPEMHLHPSAQAQIADYFITQTNKYDSRYILETHSEYLLNRIRLAIVKGDISSSDVALYHFENSADGSLTHRIELTADGQIKGAPKDFFDTYMIDVMDIALNA